MVILEFIFRNFWTFIGTFLLLGVIGRIIVYLFRGYPTEIGYSDKELITAYKIGKIDKRTGYLMDDDQILSEIKTILKNGSGTSSTGK